MTWAFVWHILFCERDDKGLPIMETAPIAKPVDEMAERDWRLGFPAHRIEERAKDRRIKERETRRVTGRPSRRRSNQANG
jgi:hypothetical protein